MKQIIVLLGLFISSYNAEAQFFKKISEKVNKAIKNENKEVKTLINKREDSIINKNADNASLDVKKQIINATTANSNTRAQALKDNEEIIYSTDFNYPDNFWNDEKDYSQGGSIITLVKNGAYTISNKSKGFITSIIDLKINTNRDFSIETAASLASGPEDRAFGVTFGQNGRVARNLFPFNAFVINLKGAYSLYSQKGVDDFDNIINFTNNASIKKRERVFNKLRIEKTGSTISLYINNVKVTNEQTFANKLPVEFYGNYIGFYVGSLQEISFDYFTVKYLDSKPKPKLTSEMAKNDVSPPTINITSPSLVNAGKATQKNRSISISGTAKDQTGIYSVSVNGKEAQLDEKGNFFATVPLVVGDNLLSVSAIDGNMNEGKVEFNITRIPDNTTADRGVQVDQGVEEIASSGKYYALIIAVQSYQDKSITTLEQPIYDASSLYNVLSTNYSFEKENMTFLKNPKRSDMFKAFDILQKKVHDNDNIIIFYAGHGYWDEARKQGYWLPSDASTSDRSSWISNADLKDNITAFNSRHTLLITDACFAGGIFKSRSLAGASRAINELYSMPSRKAMTSGTLKEVPDKSVFIEQLVKHLKANKEKYLSAQQLFSGFSEVVTNKSPNAQVPQFGVIREAGDEGGEFIFIKK